MPQSFFARSPPEFASQGPYEHPRARAANDIFLPRLYLANGVTTMRTTGSIGTYTDLNLKRDIDAGQASGSHMDVTGPYLRARELFHADAPLNQPEDARRLVEYWADQGVTSFRRT